MTQDGLSFEVAIVGNDGLVGVSALLGEVTSAHQAVAQNTGNAYRIGLEQVRKEVDQGGALLRIALSYVQTLMTQIEENALCYRHHSVEQQVCRRVLVGLNLASGAELNFTQEQIGDALSLRPDVVAEVAGALQAAGLVTFSREKIQILDRSALEARACKCCVVPRKTVTSFLQGVPFAQRPPSARFTPENLRKAAEDRHQQTLSGAANLPTDMSRLVYEHQVHEIELELQHAELASIYKQAETALRDQLKMQGLVSKIAATVPGVICSFLLRPDGTMCMPYASAALDQLYGLQPEDVRDDATPFLARIHADDIRYVNETIAASAGTMAPWRAEYRVHHPSKGILWIDGHSMPQQEPDGSILWHGYLMDITARKSTEKTLRENERIYRAIGESINYGIWICAADGRNLYASESFLKLVGITQEQCSNFGWGDVLHPDDAERTIAAWKVCVQAGADWDIEHRFRGIDGLWHEVLARGVAVRNELGEITHWAGINLDISRLKRVENALRERERDLRLAQAVAKTGSWRLNVNQDELRWSDENYRIFGVPKGAPLTYEMFLSITHPDDQVFVDKAWRNALLGAPYDIEYRIVVAGEIRWVNQRAELEFDPLGNLLGGFGCTQDISERKRSEAAFFASESRFRLAMEAISGVVYDWDKRTGSIYWSSGLSRIFGISGLDAEAGRRWWRENVHSDDMVRIQPEIVHNLKTRCTSFQLEYRMRHSAGYWMHISDCSYIVRNSVGRVVRVIGSLTDVSARMHAEEKLRRFNDRLEELVVQRTAEAEERSRALLESERFARATIDALSSSVCVLDGTGHIIAVNKAWREFAQNNGALLEQVCEGADYLTICDAASYASDPVAAQVAFAIREFIAGRRQDFSTEYECHSPETRRWFAMKLSCFPGADPLRLVVRHEVITERKLAAEDQIESAKRLRRLAAHLETVREEQSTTIAREVHDELGGTLTMAKLGLAIVANDVAESTPLHNSLRGILDQIDLALMAIKRISAELRPATLDTLGLVATIKSHVAQFSEMTGIATDLHLPEYIKLPRNRSTAIFRIIQEALTNIAKHSGASTAGISIRKCRGELTIEVSDNGIGLAKSNRFKPDSFGLIGMHERAQFLGGELSITRMPNAGTRLKLRIPLYDIKVDR